VFTTVRWALAVGLVALMGCAAGTMSNAGTRPPARPCRTAQLHGSFRNPDAGAGQRYVQLVLTNIAKVPCSVSGYPSLALIGADGQGIPTRVVQSSGAPVGRLTISPGHRISSVLHWIGIPLSDEAQTGLCEPTPSHVNITPPGEATSLSVDWSPLDPVCGHGEIDARPLRPGVPSP
jgi:hypothetical protein